MARSVEEAERADNAQASNTLSASGVLSFVCQQKHCPAFDHCDLVPTQLRIGSASKKDIVLFIGEAPGRTEASDGIPFIGRSGDLLRSTIRKLNTRGVSVAYSNAARYWPRDDHGDTCKPDLEAVKACTTHLLKDIAKLKPAKIVLLGGTALKLLFPSAPKISQCRGQHLKHEKFGEVFITYHPAFILRRQNLYDGWKSDLRVALGAEEVSKRAAKWAKPYTYRTLEKIEEVEEYVDELLDNDKLKIVALDTETANLNKRYGNVLGTFQFCEDGKRGTVIPYRHEKFGWWPEEMKRLDAALTKLFTTPNPPWRYWVFHNTGFDYRMMFNFGLGITQFNRPLMDVGMMAYCQDENRGKSGIQKPYSLESLMRDYLNVDKYEDPEIERFKKQGRMLEIEFERLAKYGASDAVYTWRLFWYILELADREHYKDKLLTLCEHWFEPVTRLNSIMSSNGFWVDVNQLRLLKDRKRSPIVKRMEELDEAWKNSEAAKKTNKLLLKSKLGGKMKPLFGGTDAWIFDINKRDSQLCLFFDVMKLDPLDYGKGTRIPLVTPNKGQKAKEQLVGKVDKAFQERYNGIEEVDMFHEHQGLKKLKTSYVTAVHALLDPRHGMEGSKDQRVRPSFWITTTDTGRSSCTDPNLQQVPRADNWAKKEIKNMYAAEPGCALIQLDFMTSEVRWWGILAQCPEMTKAFENGRKAREAYQSLSDAYVKNHPSMRYPVLAAGTAMLDDDFNIKEKKELQELKGKYATKTLKVAWKLLNTDKEFQELCKAKAYAKIAGDIHKSTASLMYSVPITKVDKDQRTATKSIVFGSMFGRGVKAIAQQLKISDLNEVGKRIRKFFDQFSDAEQWMFDTEEYAEQNGYVESPLGRRRRLIAFQLGFADDGDIARAKRVARNSPIQGISSDGAFLGAAMLNDNLIEDKKWHVHPTPECWLIEDVVHDSCVIQVPIEDVPEAVEYIRPFFTSKLMERMTDIWGVNFNIPLEVDFELGLKWGDTEAWDNTKLHLDYLTNKLRKDEIERQAEAA